MNRLRIITNNNLFKKFKKTRRTNTNNKISGGNNLSDKQLNSFSSPTISLDKHLTSIQSPDSVYNVMPAQINSNKKNNNSIYLKATEITLDHSTLEQMYSDKNIFSSQILDQNVDMTNSDTSYTSLTELNSSNLILFSSIDSSVKSLHEQIRFRLAALKYTANRQLNIPTPVNISMLDKVYEMKLQTLNKEAAKQLIKYDKSAKLFFNALSSKLKRLRNRSKSVDKSQGSKGMTKRLVIEKHFESMVYTMQLEIISSICELEVYYGQMLAVQHQQQSLLRKERPESKYYTENAMKKRIRNRYRKHHSCSTRSVGSAGRRSSSEDGDSRRSSVSFESSIIIPEKYKNACAEETTV